MAPFYQPPFFLFFFLDRHRPEMSFMFGLEKGESEAAGCFPCLVCAAESLAKTSDLVTIELS